MTILTYDNGSDILVAAIEPENRVVQGLDLNVNSDDTMKLKAAALISQLGVDVSIPEPDITDKQIAIDNALSQKLSFDNYASVNASLTDAIVAVQIAKELGLNPEKVLSNGGASLDIDLETLYSAKLDVYDIPLYCDSCYPMYRPATQLDVDESIAENVGDLIFGLHRASQQDVDNEIAEDIDEIITVAEIVNGNEVRPSALLNLIKTKIFLPKLKTISDKKESMLDNELQTLILNICNNSFKSNAIVPDLSRDQNTDWASRFSI